MQSFATRLSADDISAVAAYVASGLTSDAAYHTAANGWPDHEKRNGAAFPFVYGELSPDAPDSDLTPEQIAGRNLFRSTCVSCHSGRTDKARGNVFRRADKSREGE